MSWEERTFTSSLTLVEVRQTLCGLINLCKERKRLIFFQKLSTHCKTAIRFGMYAHTINDLGFLFSGTDKECLSTSVSWQLGLIIFCVQ